jgi:hypothetical protein
MKFQLRGAGHCRYYSFAGINGPAVMVHGQRVGDSQALAALFSRRIDVAGHGKLPRADRRRSLAQ